MTKRFKWYQVEVNCEDGCGWHEDFTNYGAAVIYARKQEAENPDADVMITGEGGPEVAWVS